MASPSRLPGRRPVEGARPRPISMMENSMLNLKLPTEQDPSSKQSKRRSLLPQFSRKVSNESRKGITEEDEDMVEGADGAEMMADRPREAFEDERRRVMPPPPPRTSRPMSLYGAGALSRPSAIKPPVQRLKQADDDMQAARAGSLAALEGTTTIPTGTSALKRASSTRVPLSPRKVHSRTSSSSTSTTEKRSSTTSTRPSSIHAEGPVSRIRQPLSPTTVQNRADVRRSQLPPMKPTFNTYQQHFSPVKSALPKPPVPSARNAKPPPLAEETTAEISTDVLRQQVELMQLSLLHQASLKTMREFDESAQRKLGRKHARLKKDLQVVHAAEMEQQRLINLSALEAWCPDLGLLAECLQVLNKVHTDLTALCEPGSRYKELVLTFETWSLAAGACFADKQVSFIEALPEEWRAAHTSLSLKLRALQHELSLLPRASATGAQTSSLEIILRSCAALLDGMLRELEIMSKMEREVLSQEKARVEEHIKVVVQGSDVENAQSAWVPAWQSVA